MHIVVVPGIHCSTLTHGFIQSIQPWLDHTWIVSSLCVPVYSPQHILRFLVLCHERNEGEIPARFLSQNETNVVRDGRLQKRGARDTTTGHNASSLLFIGFSAGVVGSIGAARQWHAQGGIVKALIAFDGWGVPLYGNFPIHRVSHDIWTHCSSVYLGNNKESFYADPPVEHLELWRSPHTTSGICTHSCIPEAQQPETAASFVRSLLEYYMD